MQNNNITTWEEKVEKQKKARKKKKTPLMKVSGRQNLNLKKIFTKRGEK
ncbi:hypothetical protein KKA15_05655 [Patescibacteria group bacterium]|nr:hypothetical protein [Patescibacteria group bacterium]